jgi:copper chaperone
MEKIILNVDGMSCEHCVKAIKSTIGSLAGIASVNVDLDKKSVSVDYDSSRISLDKIKSEIEDLDYKVI